MNQKQKMAGGDILGYLLLGVSVMMLGKSLTLCFSSDIWYDELFTVGMIEHSYGDLVAFTARDVHPPLYYCIVKFFVDLCKLISTQTNPVMIAKMVSVLPYLALTVYSVTFIRKRFGMFTGGLFLFCTVAMPQLSAYTVEVRMYGYALWFVTAAFLHAYGMITAEGGQTAVQVHGAALACYGLAAAYTQYFACVAVIVVYLYVLIVFIMRDRDRIKEWVLWVAVSIVCYAPWLYTLFQQITAVNENYWILPLTWRSLGGCVKFVMKPAFTNGTLSTILAVILCIMYAAVFGYELRKQIKLYHNGRQNEEKEINLEKCADNDWKSIEMACHHPEPVHRDRFGFIVAGIGVLAGLVLFGFAASVTVRPIFVYRYMIPALGCFWLAFAVGLHDMWNDVCVSCHNLKEKVLRTAIVVVVLGVSVIGLRDYRAFMGEEEYKMLLMRKTSEALSSIAPEDIVVYNFDQVQAVTSYYLDCSTESYLWCGTPETLIQDIIRPYGVVEEAQVVKEWCEAGRNVWFVGSFNSRDDIIKEWSAEGMRIEEIGSYLLERYWFNLYKISANRQE